MRELSGLSELLAVVVEYSCGRVVEGARLLRTERIRREWRLEGLVVLREGPFSHVGAGEKSRNSLRIHNEGAHAVGGILIDFEVGNVGAAPGGAVP
jgi:hypothetical protein